MDQINKHPLFRKYDIDNALTSLWGFYRKFFLPLFGISLAMTLTTQFISSGLNLPELQAMAYSDPDGALKLIREDFLGPALIIMAVTLIFNLAIQHFVIYKPLGMSFAGSLAGSLKYLPSYIILIILMSILFATAIIVGLLALIIGVFFTALYSLMIYLFLLPVLVSEGPGIGNAVSRSFSLSHRNFWPNIGWTAVFLILLIIISLVITTLISLPFAGSALKSIFSAGERTASDFRSSPLFIILTSIAGALTTPLMPIFGTILYFNSRANEEAIVKPEDEEYRPRVEDLYSRPEDRQE